MHPADEYEAFALLHNDKGMGADDIAARFGVTPAVVRQRLKLGAVSPALMAVFRAGELPNPAIPPLARAKSDCVSCSIIITYKSCC